MLSSLWRNELEQFKKALDIFSCSLLFYIFYQGISRPGDYEVDIFEESDIMFLFEIIAFNSCVIFVAVITLRLYILVIISYWKSEKQHFYWSKKFCSWSNQQHDEFGHVFQNCLFLFWPLKLFKSATLFGTFTPFPCSFLVKSYRCLFIIVIFCWYSISCFVYSKFLIQSWICASYGRILKANLSWSLA